jgi:hypothetical protein
MQPPTSAETEDRDTPLLFFPFFFLVGSLREQGSRVAGYNDIPLRVSTALDTSRPLTSFPFTFCFSCLTDNVYGLYETRPNLRRTL